MMRSKLVEVAKYYAAGSINTAFGFGVFSFLIWVGLNMFMAQLLSHMVGVIFNYFSYSRLVFKSEEDSRVRFILSYGLNYFIGLSSLFLISRFVESPYVSGFVSIIIVSVINYFILKYAVFNSRSATVQ